MPEGTTNGSALGFFEDVDLGEDLAAPEEVEVETPDSPESEVPEEPNASEEVAAEVEPGSILETEEPAADDGEVTVPAEAGETEPVSEEPRAYAGKFESVEALEQGYEEVQSWNTRLAQQQAAADARQADAERQIEELKAVVGQVAMEAQQRRAEEDPEYAEQLRQQQAAQQLIDQRVSAEVDPLKQQIELQKRQGELQAVVSNFMTAHQIVPGTPKDYELDGIVRAMNFDIGDPNALELAYEMSEDPHLKTVIVAQPHLVSTGEGIQLARTEAARLAAAEKPATTVTAPAEIPHVETGASGAPSAGAPGPKPKDAFDVALEMAKSGSNFW
jgi:hypothetical protein